MPTRLVYTDGEGPERFAIDDARALDRLVSERRFNLLCGGNERALGGRVRGAVEVRFGARRSPRRWRGTARA
jgi:hypothetical protein